MAILACLQQDEKVVLRVHNSILDTNKSICEYFSLFVTYIYTVNRNKRVSCIASRNVGGIKQRAFQPVSWK